MKTIDLHMNFGFKQSLRSFLVFICVFSFTINVSYTQGECFFLDFETIQGIIPTEGLEISTEYLSSNGVSFKFEDGTNPHIARLGLPNTAFNTNLGNEFVNESQLIGMYFLTDDGVLGSEYLSPLIMSFSSPLDSISGLVLDVDIGERFIIQAIDQFDSVIDQTIIEAGDPGTGDGRVTRWGFKTIKQLIHTLKIIAVSTKGGEFGFGFDNFVTCPIDASNIGQGGTTSIDDEFLRDKIKVYPNPSSGSFVIDALNFGEVSSLEIFDHIGQKVNFHYSVDRHLTKVECDYQGLILIRIQSDQGIFTQKLILK